MRNKTKYAHLTMEQLKSEMEVYSEIIFVRHKQSLEAKLEKKIVTELVLEIQTRKPTPKVGHQFDYYMEVYGYDKRVNELEAEGLTRSDAQAIVDAEDLQRKAGVK